MPSFKTNLVQSIAALAERSIRAGVTAAKAKNYGPARHFRDLALGTIEVLVVRPDLDAWELAQQLRRRAFDEIGVDPEIASECVTKQTILPREVITHRGYNHNDVLLGEYTSLAAAQRDTREYTLQTGNSARIEKV